MKRNSSANSFTQRPHIFSTKSFTRFEPSTSNVPTTQRSRASTLNTPSRLSRSPDEERQDVFSKSESHQDEATTSELNKTTSLPDKFDELPIELASLTDRFIESLSAKSWDQPPSIEEITELFQDFYVTSSNRVSIHISSLISRLNRDPSPKSTKPSPRRTLTAKKSNESLVHKKSEGAQQMLTATEVTEKRKARKMLEYKRLMLEEAVERRACKKVYAGIWRHKGTLDEVRDEKLRSKTASLALVGIGLKDLGIELDSSSGKTLEDIHELLTPARDGLMKMNEVQHPLGKLEHLTAAHKAIVDTLYSVHGSSSSADEILPTLIYTLITAPAEGINVISNLNFIQRFRGASKLDGESAYCMTNLEAAISFLENVDLSSLRADERPEGPPKDPSQPATPSLERIDPFPFMPPPTTDASIETSVVTAIPTSSASGSAANLPLKLKAVVGGSKPSLPSPRHQRTLSDLLQPVTAANEAVRNSAKESIESISNSLDNSFKFLFGRLKEQQNDPTSPKDVVVPKTLDEARQLVSRPLGAEAVVEEAIAASDTSSLAERDPPESPQLEKPRTEDKLLSLFGGRKPASSIRDRSVDSQRSNGSNSKKPVTTTSAVSDAALKPATTTSNTTQTSSSTPLESVKNIGGAFNPLNHIGNAIGSGFRSFGRPAMPTSATIAPVAKPSEQQQQQQQPTGSISKDTKKPGSTKEDDTEHDSSSLQGSTDGFKQVAKKIQEAKPPMSKFMDADGVAELKVGEIQELLDDYKRLARLLGELATGDRGS